MQTILIIAGAVVMAFGAFSAWFLWKTNCTELLNDIDWL